MKIKKKKQKEKQQQQQQQEKEKESRNSRKIDSTRERETTKEIARVLLLQRLGIVDVRCWIGREQSLALCCEIAALRSWEWLSDNNNSMNFWNSLYTYGKSDEEQEEEEEEGGGRVSNEDQSTTERR